MPRKAESILKKPDIYQPLTNKFINSAEQYKFAKIETVLWLMSELAPNADAYKAYLLFTNYHLIGDKHFDHMAYRLQQARSVLRHYSSKKAWHDDFNAYLNNYDESLRAFAFFPDGQALIIKPKINEDYAYSWGKRQQDWELLLSTPSSPASTKNLAQKDTTYYYRRKPDSSNETKENMIEVNAIFTNCKTETEFNASMDTHSPQNPKSAITIKLSELIEAAEAIKMKSPNDHALDVLSQNILKTVSNGKVSPTDCLLLERVTNIVGMVGAGKSTLVKVLAYWMSQNGYRLVIVLTTVREVMDYYDYLYKLGVSCTPLIGKSEILLHLDKLHKNDDMYFEEHISRYLTPCCLLDGQNTQNEEAISFGQEPCFSLKSREDKNGYFLCSYFEQCSATAMYRDCYQAAVVLTTVAGFAETRVGAKREVMFELALRDFDLVIFDECDYVQNILDRIFMPDIHFDNLINSAADECRDFMHKTSKERESDTFLQIYNELQRQSVTVHSCVVKAVNWFSGSNDPIKHEQSFSAMTLLEKLYNNGDGPLSQAVYDELYQLMDSNNQKRKHDESISKNLLNIAYNTSCHSLDFTLFNHAYHMWCQSVSINYQKSKDSPDILDNQIKLIILLIYFDHFMQTLNKAYSHVQEIVHEHNELTNFLGVHFHTQQKYLPAAPVGNLFGLIKTDEEDIIVYRQYAFGRSMMIDFPYLILNEKGEPLGPHVLLLSGTSWAPGSYEYHVNCPVHYILEISNEKRDFLTGSHFYESGSLFRVSGSQNREDNLNLLAADTEAYILQELQQKRGKLLFIVNSYHEAKILFHTLNALLAPKNYVGSVCYLIPDDAALPHDKDLPQDKHVLRRGDVGLFADRAENILIAPAVVIQRGHNIVSKDGHSVLGSVFFMVRPLSRPDNIQQRGCKLNGQVAALTHDIPYSNLFEKNEHFRQIAMLCFKKQSKKIFGGLAYLDEAEKTDIIASLFILILQIYGRLARVTNLSNHPPNIYFVDGAWRPSEANPNGFNCLNELYRYLDTLIKDPVHAEIAQALYYPFYVAFQKGIEHA